jgi:hypothetical protein
MSRNIKEEVYDNRMQDLITELAAIAKEHDINLIIAADIGRGDFDRQMVASTVLLFEGCHQSFVKLKHVLIDGYHVVTPPAEEQLVDDFNLDENPQNE